MSTLSGSNPAPASAESVITLKDFVPLFPFLDLKAQFRSIRHEIMAAVFRVMESQQFILGEEVQALEGEIASLIEVREAISCASGTAALELTLEALGVGQGDEVITTPYTFVATAGAIARVGARPVFVDIDPATYNIDSKQIEAAVTERSRAIIPVHLFGLPAELNPILEVATRHRLAVVEDAAQAIGAEYTGKKVGGFGTLGCFSFFPSKNLGGAGDGGIITTQDQELADRLRRLRVHGSRKKYHYEILGTNSRLDALQAAILRAKLPYLPQWTRQRQEVASRYSQLFAQHRLEQITLPAVPPNCTHVYNQFVIRCPRCDELREFLRSRGIPSEIYYPIPLHLQPAFADLNYHEGDFPQAEAASRETLALPIYPELREEHQVVVVKALAEFYEP
jgi:dTDP-4-amino-4,6-dideoxygalactose transaminase